MKLQLIVLWTDCLIFILFFSLAVFFFLTYRLAHWRNSWHYVAKRKLAMIALVLLAAYSLIMLLDSIHFRILSSSNSVDINSYQVQSLLDVLLRPLGQQNENSYSAPFALFSSVKVTSWIKGNAITYYPRLVYGGALLTHSADRAADILKRTYYAITLGGLISLFLCFISVICYAYSKKLRFKLAFMIIILDKDKIAWREMLITTSFIIIIICFIKLLTPYYHVLGTNKVGGDVLYEAIKSIRTGLVIGTLTTLIMLPFALGLGTIAGFYGGWRDDIIQYVYTTLSSIPGVLLISAAVLSLQLFINNHGAFFPTLESRADARLVALCLILGITSWTSLCRLLRAETLKLREMDFIKAATALGVRDLITIWRHILPNVMHIVLITLVLDFSALVLAEAVLSYVGVGVDPITPSWGNMINSARLDLAREPVVWWPLLAAFIFMFTLVLSANLFADAVQDAFDPRIRNEV